MIYILSKKNQEYVDNYSNSTYLYSPVIEEAGYWYDIDLVNEFIKEKTFSCILVDGPAATVDAKCPRCGLYDNLKIRKTKTKYGMCLDF